MEISIIALPLIASIISGFFGKLIGDRSSEIITSLLVSISAIFSVLVLYEVVVNQYQENIIIATWISSGSLEVNWSMKIDSLSAVMLVVVTSVSALVHIYSIGYMSHDPHKPRFMAYLSLFTFAMLMLVTADNFIQLFFGWEGVGLCSYFLIGFWFKKESANKAAIKAFVVNRVGDFGFALGIFLIFYLFGSVNYSEVFAKIPNITDKDLVFLGITFNAVDLICLLLFIGAMGKSAQILLHTWLPDAMEGPTPVSALIHAATMVTAGVFLVVRCSPIYEYSDLALNIITIVGMSTAFFAATVALVQNDIKKIIAYSTCSQLGYMFFATGVGAYNVAMFHLFTHAFFKALLFLGSGSVIHAFKDEQNINNMGGGNTTGYYAAGIGIFTAFLTSIYSWRLIFKTFHGEYNNKEIKIDETHESPIVMLIPLVLLSIGAIFAGFLFKELFIGYEGLNNFWRDSIFFLKPLSTDHPPLWFLLLTPTLVILSIPLAYYLFLKNRNLPERLASINKPLYQFLLNKWYFDELYDVLFVKPSKKLGLFLWKFFDLKIIDGFGPDGISSMIKKFSVKANKFQSGYIYQYAFVMLLGFSALLTFLIVK